MLNQPNTQITSEIQSSDVIITSDPRATDKAETNATLFHAAAVSSNENAASPSALAVAPTDYVAAVNDAMRAMKDALNSSASLEVLLNTFVNVEDRKEELYEFGHEKAYEMLQNAYALAQTAFGTRKQEWIELSKERGFDITVKTENRYTRIVKTMWAKSEYCNDKKIVVWKHNRSTEKYANVFRYMDENNIPATKVASVLRSYKNKDHGNGLSGIVAADRANHASKPASDLPDGYNIACQLVESTKPSTIGVVKCPSTIRRPAGSGMIYLAARLEGDELHLLGDVKIPDKMVASDLQRIMKNAETGTAAE